MYIDYSALVSSAMLEVVKKAFKLASNTQKCNFFIRVNTQAPGVILPEYVKKSYPEEISIILEHQFSDLTINDKDFSVKLSFSDQYTIAVIPFFALLYFADRENKFSLEFKKRELNISDTDGAKNNKIIYLDTLTKKKKEDLN